MLPMTIVLPPATMAGQIVEWTLILPDNVVPMHQGYRHLINRSPDSHMSVFLSVNKASDARIMRKTRQGFHRATVRVPKVRTLGLPPRRSLLSMTWV